MRPTSRRTATRSATWPGTARPHRLRRTASLRKPSPRKRRPSRRRSPTPSRPESASPTKTAARLCGAAVFVCRPCSRRGWLRSVAEAGAAAAVDPDAVAAIRAPGPALDAGCRRQLLDQVWRALARRPVAGGVTAVAGTGHRVSIAAAVPTAAVAATPATAGRSKLGAAARPHGHLAVATVPVLVLAAGAVGDLAHHLGSAPPGGPAVGGAVVGTFAADGAGLAAARASGEFGAATTPYRDLAVLRA